MTLEYKRKYITANVVMLGFVGESFFSESAAAASAAAKTKNDTFVSCIIRNPSALGVLIQANL